MRVAVIAGCLVLATTPALAQSKAAIQKLNDLWAEAYNKGDAKAVAAMYTSDAYMLPASAPMIKAPRRLRPTSARLLSHMAI